MSFLLLANLGLGVIQAGESLQSVDLGLLPLHLILRLLDLTSLLNDFVSLFLDLSLLLLRPFDENRDQTDVIQAQRLFVIRPAKDQIRH